jgi:hypothetical protein
MSHLVIRNDPALREVQGIAKRLQSTHILQSAIGVLEVRVNLLLPVSFTLHHFAHIFIASPYPTIRGIRIAVAARWSAQLPRWKPCNFDGKAYSLSHLNPRSIEVAFAQRGDLPAVSVEIRVGFMSHTFTTACPTGNDPHPDYSGQQDPRIFSPERYELSLCLPEIIDSLAGRRCYVSSSGHGNHFVIEGLPGMPPGQEYWVFLQIEKVESAIARLRVCSAYSGLRARAPYGRGRQSMLFRELVARTLGLKKQTPPQGRGS